MTSVSPDFELAQVLNELDATSKRFRPWLYNPRQPASNRTPGDGTEPSVRERLRSAVKSVQDTLLSVAGGTDSHGGPNYSRYAAPIVIKRQLETLLAMNKDFDDFKDAEDLTGPMELVSNIFALATTAHGMLVSPDCDLESKEAQMELMRFNYSKLTRGTKFGYLANYVDALMNSTRPDRLQADASHLKTVVLEGHKQAFNKLSFSESSGLLPRVSEYKDSLSAVENRVAELSVATKHLADRHEGFASTVRDTMDRVDYSLTSIGRLVPRPDRVPVEKKYLPALPPPPPTDFESVSLDETVAAPTYEDPLDKYLKMDSEQRFAAAESALVDLSGLATGELGTEIDSFVTETREMLKEAKSQYESYKAFESNTE